MANLLLVMAGGAIGSALRYLFGQTSVRLLGIGWPWGTLGVNIIGGFVMGLFAGWLATRGQVNMSMGNEPLRLFFAVGLLGGFTTFSAFSLDAMMMIERGELVSAASYALVSVFASIIALAIGLGMMRAVA